MECEKWSIKEDVPSALSFSTTASAAFYAIPRPLCIQEGIQRHTLCATKQGHLVEVGEADNIIRSVTLIPAEVIKIVVHHEFGPRQLYVALLYKNNKAAIISYKDFKVVYECDGVASVSSEDPRATGIPQLYFTHLTGTVEVIPGMRLLSMNGQTKHEVVEESQQGVKKALDAMVKRLKSCTRQTEWLRGQRYAKERYIQGSLSALQAHLAGQKQEYTSTLMPALSFLGEKDQDETAHPISQQTLQSSQPPPLKVLDVRQKIIHDKWVIGVNIVNKGDRMVVKNLRLLLCADGGAETLNYITCILKSVRRGPSSDSSDPPTTSIELLQPPVLRPGKKACVLGICEMPTFVSGPTVTCSGLLTYTCTSLRTRNTQLLVPGEGKDEVGSDGIKMEIQTNIGVVQVRVDQLSAHQISLNQDPVHGGVSFSSVAMVAGSIASQVCFTTLNSPLTDMISYIDRHYKLIKVAGLTDFYCFWPDRPHPLRQSAFTITLSHAHTAHLTLYTRDKAQAAMVIQCLLSVLPSDISVKPYISNAVDYKETKKIHHKLHNKMNEAVSVIIEGFEMRLEKKQRKKTRMEGKDMVESPKKDISKPRDARMARQQEAYQRSSEFEREQQKFHDREGTVTFGSEDYTVWRNSLKDMQLEIDKLYVKYAGQTCVQ